MSSEKRIVIIIGGGISGLTLALALKHISQRYSLDLEPHIYEKEPSYNAGKQKFHILWRYAVTLLLQLGLGKRLGRISWPILRLESLDAETRESLVEWPEAKQDLPNAAISAEYAYLPPLLGIRHQDLVRLLMTALAGRLDLVYDTELAVRGANNSLNGSNNGFKGLDGDLAVGDWFQDGGFANLLPNLHLGHELESYRIASSTGAVTAQFTNGVSVSGFMMVGADGVDSKVRDLLLNQRIPAQHALSAVFQGVVHLDSPATDLPISLDTGKPFGCLLSKDDLKLFCPDGSMRSFVDRGVSFGVANLGNGMLGWTLLASQAEEGQVAGEYALKKRRREIGAVVANMPKNPGAASLIVSGVQGLHSSPSAVSVDQWIIPDNRESVFDRAASPDAHSASIHIPDDAPTSAPVIDDKNLKSALTITTAANAVAQASAPDLQLQLERNSSGQPFSAPARSHMPELAHPAIPVDSSNSAASNPARLVHLPTFPLDMDSHVYLNGTEARDLATYMLSRYPSFPVEASALICHTQPTEVSLWDNIDLGRVVPESYTSPKYHAGRVILIGDAAHAVAMAAHGNNGASLGICDAAVLAKLLGHHFSTDPQPILQSLQQAKKNIPRDPSDVDLKDSIDSQLLEALSKRFDALRVPPCSTAALDGRLEATWNRQEEGIWKNIVKMSVGYTWSRSTFQQRLTRGSAEMGDESISWPVLTPKVTGN